MSRIARIFGSHALGIVLLAGTAAAGTQLDGTLAPDFALRSLAGQNLRLSEYRGEVVMLSFWASWCGQCRQEIPELEDLYQRYQRVGLTLLGVSIDDDRRKTEDMVQTLEVSFPVLMDERREVSRLYRVDDMPAAVLIDREGTVRYTHYGYGRKHRERYLEQIRELLRE